MNKTRNKLGQFLKGLIPWNKGDKSFRPSIETEFKSGVSHTGDTHPSWKGGEQLMKNDCTHVWTSNGERVRKPRMIYEEAHGSIPKGYIIYHIDGDKRNDSLLNLEAISRSELLKRNNNNRNEKKTNY